MVNARKRYIAAGCIILLLFTVYNQLMLNTFLDELFGHANGLIEVYNVSVHDSINNNSCVRTHTTPSYTICPFNTLIDKYISSALLTDGIWEPKMTKIFQNILQHTRNVTVIDIGANIGYFTLLAAAMGHRVIAAEPVQANVERLSKALFMNDFQTGVTLLKNVISDSRGVVNMKLSTTNQGGHKVISGSGNIKLGEHVIQANSIVLDDLGQFINTRNVVIKMDIEGHECKAMELSEDVFNTFRVKYIVMEWNKMTAERNRYQTACPGDKIRELTDTFERNGYSAFDIRHGTKLDLTESERWTYGDIYWTIDKSIH